MKANLAGALALSASLGLPQMAQAAMGATPEKLEAPLPSVTVLGTARGGQLRPDQRVSPEAMASASLSLPLPVPRRGTREESGRLGVEVTPSTLLAPPLADPGKPVTQLLAAYAPTRLGRAELLDARAWGPAWGSLRAGGLSGANWWRLSGQGQWRLPDQGRLAFSLSQLRTEAPLQSGQGLFGQAEIASAPGQDLAWAFKAEGAQLQNLTTPTSVGANPWNSLKLSAQGRHQWQLAGGHELSAEATGQWRQWGALTGPEAYLRLGERFSPNEAFSADLALGGGQWGFEPILDPSFRLAFRPAQALELSLGGRTRSILPDAAAQVRDRQSVAPNFNLAAERAEGEGELGLAWAPWPNLRLSAEAGGHRTHRLQLWALTPADGRWSPTNQGAIQIGPKGQAEAAWQITPQWQLSLGYAGRAAFPLNWAEHRGVMALQGLAGPFKAQAQVALRGEQLVGTQLAGGGLALGLVAAAEARWAVLPQLEVVGSLQDWGQALGTGPGLSPFGLLPTAGLGLALTF